MFMREGQGAVVELQPADLSTTQHQGRYKNLAATLGQKYFSVKTEVDSLGQGGSGEADVEQSLGGDTLNQIDIELARRGTELSLGAGEFRGSSRTGYRGTGSLKGSVKYINACYAGYSQPNRESSILDTDHTEVW
jgi:hypothetical protein